MIRCSFVFALLWLACVYAKNPSAADVAQAVRDAELDSEACFRVRELNFAKEDVRFYLTDGFLAFGKPVLGERLFAIFSGDVEGGDAEVLLMPPHRSERRSLAKFSKSPNLAEHFKTALFLFSDGTGNELFERARESGRVVLEMGALLKDQYGSMARNITSSFELRLVQDLLSPDRVAGGVFLAAVAGGTLGNFDIIHDPWSHDQVLVGQYTTRGVRPTFDIWTSFESRSIRTGRRQRPKPQFTLTDYRIEASLDDALHMSAVTRAKLRVSMPSRAFAVQVSEKMEIGSVTLDGQPLEIYARESLRESALRGSGNVTFVVLTPELVQPGEVHELEFHHEGDVVLPAGNDVFFVTSRGNWYPRSGLEFSTYDLTFRYPKRLTLVATGEPAEDRTEGEFRISRRVTSGPVRMAGFNLGNYESVKLNRGGYHIAVYGNRRVETSLQPRSSVLLVPRPTGRLPQRPEIYTTPPPPAPNPGARLSTLAENVAGAFEYMLGEYGPPPLRWLTVSPIPGAFGQGFPGLVYLSTLTYLPPEQRPQAHRNRSDEVFFSELLPAHEVAHQWWGNMTTAAGYQDEWLMEALASYSAVQYLEKRRGARAVEEQLGSFQQRLLQKMEDGRTIESAGPITWGLRLHSSLSAGAWRIITYDKGAWIIHMLRRRMGDANFRRLQAELNRRFAREAVSTEQFRMLAEEIIGGKPGSNLLSEFFESWVYGTGIPTLALSYTAKGKAPSVKITGTVTQSGVEDDFGVDVPVEIQFAKGPAITHWVRSSSEPVSFNLNLKRAPIRVMIPAGTGILALRK